MCDESVAFHGIEPANRSSFNNQCTAPSFTSARRRSLCLIFRNSAFRLRVLALLLRLDLRIKLRRHAVIVALTLLVSLADRLVPFEAPRHRRRRHHHFGHRGAPWW